MPPKRQSPGSASIARMGPRTAEKPIEFQSSDEFTRSVKRKLSSSTRTGQACDRCKVRKIRCDGLQGGCSPCMTNNTECRTTDRISQRAMPRGYVENLESKCLDLEEKLKEARDALALERSARGGNQAVGYINGGAKHDNSGMRNGAGYVNWPNAGEYGEKLEPQMPGNSKLHPKLRNIVDTGRLGSFRTGTSTGAYYLGLSSGASTLNSIKDSALSVLGIEIDLSDVDPSEEDGPDGLAESYSRFLSSMFNANPNIPQQLSLPPKAEFFEMVDWFFTYSFPYLPVLHRPTFIPQVERIFDCKDSQPSAGLMVQAHMIVAIYYWQFGTRERTSLQDTPIKLDLSYQHYYYALTHFAAMLNSAGLEDLQAMCLVLQHIRGFRKPGATWFVARLAISMAVELGLHRSTKRWNEQPVQNYIQDEMRKRVWWCLLTVEVSLGAKLGRPMSVREGDYDTELPERIDDEYITAEGFLPVPDNVEGCRFDVGIELFKIIPLYTEINCSLYTITRPNRERYVKLVEDLEQKLLQWREGVPKYISKDSPKVEHKFQAIHLDLWLHECRLLIRHPSLSLSVNPAFNRKSINLCVEASREILHLTDILRKVNIYLDTTWYAITLQMLATLTILFSMWKTADQDITQEQIKQVQEDMDLCQDIMGDIGILLGKPHTLKDVVRKLTQGTMDYLYQRQQALHPTTEHAQRPKYMAKDVIGSSILTISPTPPSTTSPSTNLPPLTTASSLPYFPIQPVNAYVTVPVTLASTQGPKLAHVPSQLLPSHHDASEISTSRVTSPTQPSTASGYHNPATSNQTQFGVSIATATSSGPYSHISSSTTSPVSETAVGTGGDSGVTSGYYSNAQHLQHQQQYPWGWQGYVEYVSTIDIEPTQQQHQQHHHHHHHQNQQMHSQQHHQQHQSHHQPHQQHGQQHHQQHQQPQHSQQHQQQHHHQAQQHQQRARLTQQASNSSLVQAGLAGLMTLGVGNDGGWPGYSLSSEGVGRGNTMSGDNIP